MKTEPSTTWRSTDETDEIMIVVMAMNGNGNFVGYVRFLEVVILE